ncbi:MAG TPA: hypothetical protein VME45_16815 [Stellaceae bacterium]|nr:hypothetical protein [Stellaceae bacterium]
MLNEILAGRDAVDVHEQIAGRHYLLKANKQRLGEPGIVAAPVVDENLISHDINRFLAAAAGTDAARIPDLSTR